MAATNEISSVLELITVVELCASCCTAALALQPQLKFRIQSLLCVSADVCGLELCSHHRCRQHRQQGARVQVIGALLLQ
jgi:hypothetical protein